MTKHASAETRAKAVTDYLGGMSSAEVASCYGVSSMTVSKWVHDAGGEVRGPGSGWSFADAVDRALTDRALHRDDVVTTQEAIVMLGLVPAKRGASLANRARLVGLPPPPEPLFTVWHGQLWRRSDIEEWARPRAERLAGRRRIVDASIGAHRLPERSGQGDGAM